MANPLPVESYDVVNVDAIAATIRTMESGGDYTAQSKNSTASGAYQMLDTTWQGLARQQGNNDAAIYPRAKDAPPAVQDKVAITYISSILAANNNNVAAVPETWYVGNVNTANANPDAVPPGNNISIRNYVTKWLDTFHKQSGQSPGNGNIVGGIGGVIGNAGGIAGAVGSGVAGTVGGILSPFGTVLGAVTAIWGAITNKSNWIHILMIAGGAIMILFGLYILANSLGVAPDASTVAKTAVMAA